MKEDQNHQRESEQLNFLNGTIKAAVNEKEKDRGVKDPSKSKEESVETVKTLSF